MKPVKKMVLLHDLCGVGKAAMTNMLPILGVMGVEACPIPTMLLSSHTGGYGAPAIEAVSTEYIKACAAHYQKQGVTFDMIFIGYLGSKAMGRAVIDFITAFPDTMVVLDPIMGDNGVYYKNFGAEYRDAIREIIPYTDLILPNLTEYFLLTKTTYEVPQNEAQIQAYCKTLGDMGAKQVVITSVPSKECQKGIALWNREQQFMYLSNNEVLSDYHGTGDAFDAVLTAHLLNGYSIEESAKKAHEFVCACIKESSRYEYAKREGLMIEKSLKNLYK